MKKKLFGFIKGCIAVVLILVVAAILFSVVSCVGIFICVLALVLLILTLPVNLYRAIKSIK
jgi:hypothetical protein